MIATKEKKTWNYNKKSKELTLEVEELSLADAEKQYKTSVLITRHTKPGSHDVSTKKLLQATCEAGEYLLNTKPKERNTYQDHVKKITKGWSIPHPSLLIQANELTLRERVISGNLLRNDQRVWTSFSVPTGSGEPYQLHGILWYVSQGYRLDLMFPKNRVAMQTKAMYSQKIE